jgi:prophage regulatory protein
MQCLRVLVRERMTMRTITDDGLARPGRTLLGKKRVRERIGLSDRTVFNLERAGNFPQRVAISPNRVGWFEDEIDAWLASRPRVLLPQQKG